VLSGKRLFWKESLTISAVACCAGAVLTPSAHLTFLDSSSHVTGEVRMTLRIAKVEGVRSVLAWSRSPATAKVQPGPAARSCCKLFDVAQQVALGTGH
jgi:hypothetical protein